MSRRDGRTRCDLAALDWISPRAEFHAYLGALVRAGMGKRILFGSDQMYWPEAIGMAVESVDAAPFLTSDDKRDIFHENAVPLESCASR